MTVESIMARDIGGGGPWVNCQWFVGTDLKEGTFALDALEIADPRDRPVPFRS